MAVKDESRDILKTAQENVPVDSSGLKNSGKVVFIGSNQVLAQGTISFSGPHALAIEMYPSQHSPPSWKIAGHVNFRVGGPRYLTKAVNGAISGMSERIASKVRLRSS